MGTLVKSAAKVEAEVEAVVEVDVQLRTVAIWAGALGVRMR